MAVSLTDEKNIVYGKGDACLKINPFDNYRMFTLYENWKDDDRKTIDVSNGQKIYLVFKSRKKEIRIPECNTTDVGYVIDKVNGQVLFKISKKNAVDILSMDDHTFYITRVYETTDMTGTRVVSSEEEVIYTGQWVDESVSTVEDYTSKIKKLTNIVQERNKSIQNLQESNAKLMEQNVDFASQIEALKESNDKLSAEMSVLEAKISEYESGAEYDGTVLGKGTTVHITSDKEYTEEQWAEVVKSLESTSID